MSSNNKDDKTRQEIISFVEALSGYNSQDLLRARRTAVLSQTETSDKHVASLSSPKIGESHVFVAPIATVDTAFEYTAYLNGSQPTVADSLRADSGLFWVNKPNQNPKLEGTLKNQLCYMAAAGDSIVENYVPMKMHFSTLVPSSEQEDGSTSEWILIEGNDKLLKKEFDAQSFSLAVANKVTSMGVMRDTTLSAKKLIPKHRLSDHASHLTGHVDIHGDYNYWDGNYEAAISNDLVTEHVIPNMYVFFAYQESEEPNPLFEKLLSLGGEIDLSNHQEMFSSKRKNQQVRATPSEKYFQKWVSKFGKALSKLTIMDLQKSYQNLLFSIDDVDKLASYENKKELFPMWMHIEFTTDRLTEFAETMKESQLMGMLQREIMNAVSTNSLESMQMFEAYEVDAPTITATAVASPEAQPPKAIAYRSVPRNSFSLDQWIEQFMNTDAAGGSVIVDDMFSTFLGTQKASEVVSSDPKYKFFKSLMAVILKGRFKKLIKKHSRTTEQLFKGHSAYHESVLYRVSKYKNVPTPESEPLQSIYIPNSNKLDVFRYIDTQVKYDEEYTYTVTGYELVVGNDYSYEEVLTDVSWGKWAAVRVRNKPSLVLMEVPLYQHTNRVLDNPPIHPEVEFIPYKGVNNRIKILMNSGIGRYDIPYETIEASEQEQITRIRRAQNKPSSDLRVKYETDDHPAFFEVWRMNRKPKSFSDFTQKKIHQISTSLANTKLVSSGIAVDDKIKPNTKYYYCVRAIDNHGHISYPSPIYEVEMVDDKGSIYPVVELCEFAPKFDSQQTIGGMRYIHLTPSMPQTMVNEEASGMLDIVSVENLEKITMSIAEEALWDKKIKIRLTSKSTGRKMDFNVTFKHKHMKLENRD